MRSASLSMSLSAKLGEKSRFEIFWPLFTSSGERESATFATSITVLRSSPAFWCHLRHWHVLLDQILRFEVCPELGGDLRLHGSVIRKDLLFAFAAHDEGRGNVGCCRELQSGGWKVYSMIGRHIQKLSPLFNKGCRNLIGLFSIVI